MPSHRHLLSGVDIPLAAFVAAVGFAGAFLGTLFGFVTGSSRRSGVPGSHPEVGDGRPATWKSLAELQAELAKKDQAIRRLERRYELDTGLLKQEIHRLNSFLVGFQSPGPVPSSASTPGESPEGEAAVAPGRYQHEKVVGPQTEGGGASGIRFAPLEDLTPEPAGSDAEHSDGAV